MKRGMEVIATMRAIRKGEEVKVGEGGVAYLVFNEGEADVNDIRMTRLDRRGMIMKKITINPGSSAHVLILEMAKK